MLTRRISSAWAATLVCASILYQPQPSAAEEISLLGLGDSIGEGVQSADASFRTQPASYIKLLAKQMNVAFRLPLIDSGPFGVVGEVAGRERVFPFVPGANLAVSGADVDELLNEQADAVAVADIDSETDLVLFPRIGSQMTIAESLQPAVIACWIGNNDVLGAATTFDQLDASQLTSVDEFTSSFREVVARLDALGVPLIFANIPDITNIGFLVDRDDLIRFLGSDFGLPEGHFTSIVAMFLISLGLDDGSILQDPDFVLDADEVVIIQDRIEIFNQIIEEEVSAVGMPVVDVNALLDEISENPLVISGVTITPRYLKGVFSLDGVHPSNTAHALITNAFIDNFNAHFGVNVPPLSQQEIFSIFLTDPFVDKDDDNRVRGRPLAGFLETLGPSLGISGDRDDLVPSEFPAPSEEELLRAHGLDREGLLQAFRSMLRSSFYESAVEIMQ